MPLVINAPEIEGRLRRQAARRGVSVAEYAVKLLASDLEEAEAEQDASDVPFYARSTPEEWVAALNQWIESHPIRKALPDNAFDRASFYDGRS